MAYLKIRRTSMTPIRKGIIQGFSFKLEVLEAIGLPKEIFVFLRIPAPNLLDEPSDQFQSIASPSDIQQYPATAPYPDTNYPFFRLSEATFNFRSESIADDAWRCMQADFDALVTATEESAELSVEEVVEYGHKSSSSSSSSS
jgi:hypothetical protein